MPSASRGKLAASGPLPWIVPPIYVVASLAAWLLYAFDKSAAMNQALAY